MKQSYDRSISLICPTCASSAFTCLDEIETEESKYKCASCEGVFSYREIKEGNGERIHAAVQEMKSEIVADIRRDFKKLFK